MPQASFMLQSFAVNAGDVISETIISIQPYTRKYKEKTIRIIGSRDRYPSDLEHRNLVHRPTPTWAHLLGGYRGH